MDKKKILIVDDEHSNRYLLERIIQKMSLECVLAENSHEALKVLDDVHLIISDFEMPGMNGLEFAIKARENKCFVPIIIVTGAMSRLSHDYLETMLSVGVNAVVGKPIDNGRLIALINFLLVKKVGPPIREAEILVRINYSNPSY